MPQPIEALAEQVSALNTAWSEFKDTNDKRLKAIEDGKGAAEFDAKLDKLNKEISDKQSIIDQNIEAQKKRDDEMERKINQLTVGAANGNGKKEDITDNAKKFFAVASNKPLSAMKEVDTELYAKYRNNYENMLRYGANFGGGKNGEFLDVMSAGGDPDGGYLVPTEMFGQIITRIFETSPVRSIAGQITIGTDELEIPNDVNDIASGGWVGETETRDETDTPQVGKQKIVTHEQYAQPKVTQKILDDAQIDIEAWLNGKIADKFARTENTAFISGDGINSPRGFLDYGAAAVTTPDASRGWGKLQYIPTGAAAGFPIISGATIASDSNALLSTIYALKPAYRANARWLMARSTVELLRKLRDEWGNYLWQPGLQAGQPSSLLNYPITEGEDMPVAASNSLSIAFGDFSKGYLIVDRMGIRILRDPFTEKPFVKFYSTKRVGGDVVDFDAIKLLKFSAS